MRQASGETLSGSILAGLRETVPDLQTRNWRAVVKRELLMASRVGGSPRGFCAAINAVKFIPDAYVVNKRERYLDFFEIEVYNPMTRAKLHAYAKLVTDLHWYGIELAVYVVNKYGHINRVDLLPHYLEWVDSHQAR